MGKRALVVVGSLAGTGLLLALVFSLGSWGYQHRKASLHAGRLQRATALHPSADQVQAGLEAEGGRSVGQAQGAAEIARLSARWAPGSQAAIAARSERFPNARVFVVDDVVYFLFFDGDGRLSDFVLAMPR